MDAENDNQNSQELEPREPSTEDLVELCRELNANGVAYMIVGGFAIINAGYPRRTSDVDILMDTSRKNEALVYKSLEIFHDKAVLELQPGDVSQYNVVRVADEIVVDLMRAACGIEYAEASKEVVIREVQGVPIPFASPRLLWRMKSPLKREKDQGDIVFLREYFKVLGEEPPEC